MKKNICLRSIYFSFELIKTFLFISLILLFNSVNAQQRVIQLYNGAAPGSENWTWDEKENSNNQFGIRAVYNVSHPTLTVFLPDSSIANGTSVIICPGGAWHLIAIEDGGYELAKWLNKRGIAAFVLKYRIVHVLTDDPVKEHMTKFPSDPHSDRNNTENKEVIDLAIADGLAAIAYVRVHAVEFGIVPDRIGITGGSSGGTIAAATAYHHSAESRPNFVVPLYPHISNFIKSPVPKDAPPMFIVAATDDQIGFNLDCVDLYKAWVLSKHSAEIHIYSKGGHGFVMRKQGLPSDKWIDLFADWPIVEGLLQPKK